jgi:hypothetical protein
MITPEDYVIFHLINTPFYNSRTRPISISDSERGSFYTLFVSNHFYPAVIPETKQLVALTVTSGSLEEKIKESVGADNELVLVDPHETRIEKNYVSYGRVIKVKLPKELYSLYLNILNFSLALEKPLAISRNDELGTHYIPISPSLNFHIKTISRFGRQDADCAFSVILVRFEKEDFRYAVTKVVDLWWNQKKEIVTLSGSVLYFSKNGLSPFPIRLKVEKTAYKDIVNRGIGIYICHIYTVYNIIRNQEKREENNYLINVIFFDYSFESLMPFNSPAYTESGLIIKWNIPISSLLELRNRALNGLPEVTMMIKSNKPWYKVKYSNDEINVIVISPKIIFQFLKAYTMFPQIQDVLIGVLSADDLLESISNFLNSIQSSGFYNGNLVDPHIKSFLLNSVK